MSKIKILIVDDHALVREGIILMLKMTDDIAVVGEACNGLEAIDMAQIHSPDVILMDIIMPEMNGIEALEQLKKKVPKTRVILLSMEITEEFISEALAHDVKGYLPKDVRKKELIAAIRKVYMGEEYFDQRVSEVIFKNFHKKKTGKTKITRGGGKLSAREEEILILIGKGFSNREIAEKLFISVRTVDAHRSHIMQKLDLKNTVELIKFAIKTGLISI